MQSKHFLIYADTGASADCIGQWKVFFETHQVSYSQCTANDIMQGVLDNADVLIMPGGADLPYCAKLNGIGNQKIKSFVEQGGIYFGICAGAYYAHSAIAWHNTTENITGNRELRFFNATATGPIVKPYNPNTFEGMAFVTVHFEEYESTVYYKGGPIMGIDDSTETIATFTHKDKTYPAIIRKAIGHGVVIGMSPHMEYSDVYLSSINAPLCDNRTPMFSHIMATLFDTSCA